MNRTAEFRTFLSLYEMTMASSLLTVAEKTAIIEAAFDEYRLRQQPPHYMQIAKRLASGPVSSPVKAEASLPRPAKVQGRIRNPRESNRP